jgi:hypothetical protein
VIAVVIFLFILLPGIKVLQRRRDKQAEDDNAGKNRVVAVISHARCTLKIRAGVGRILRMAPGASKIITL